jgi:rare lipoprotein A
VSKGFRNRGIASWYGKRFHGRKTASGQRFDMNALTAAHRTLPLPSYVRVTNPTNGASVVVLVNDRGPYARNRVIDLSYAAASALGITKRGTAMVDLEVIANPPTTLASAAAAVVPGEESPLAMEATAID